MHLVDTQYSDMARGTLDVEQVVDFPSDEGI